MTTTPQSTVRGQHTAPGGDPHAGVGPWAGFAMAAGAAVRDLHSRFGGDLWAVERGDRDSCVVVAAAGPRAGRVTRASVESPSAIRLPLLDAGDQQTGWLTGLHPRAFGRAREEARAAALLLGGLLSTIAAGEQAAADRSAEAAAAHALAHRDAHTGLFNRRGWGAALAAEEDRARRYGRAVSVFVVDLDGLRRLNGSAGHQAGDDALTSCADVLLAGCRPGDVVARLGGDEFAVLAVECGALSARALGVRLREALRSAGVPVSIGVATRWVGEDLETTVHRADREMYRVEQRRRGRRSPGPARTAACTTAGAGRGRVHGG